MENTNEAIKPKINPLKMGALIFGVLTLGGLVLVFNLSKYRSISDNNEPLTRSGMVEVVLTQNGYQPEVVIRKGTTVVFKSELGKPYWPASNLHPSHEIYGDFDPKRPLAPDETWSFKFDRIGVWDMHDHIRSYYTGRIRVVE